MILLLLVYMLNIFYFLWYPNAMFNIKKYSYTWRNRVQLEFCVFVQTWSTTASLVTLSVLEPLCTQCLHGLFALYFRDTETGCFWLSLAATSYWAFYIFNHHLHRLICLLSYEVNSLGPHHLHGRLPRSLTHLSNTRLFSLFFMASITVISLDFPGFFSDLCISPQQARSGDSSFVLFLCLLGMVEGNVGGST